MGIGILSIKGSSDANVPGTCLFDPPLDSSSINDNLKRDRKNPELVLRPQPSNSPVDPLNWSDWRKEAYYASMMLGTIVVGVVGPSIVPAAGNILTEFAGTTVTQFIALIGYLVLTYGISSYLCVCLSDTIGRRPTYLISHVLLIVGLIWGASAKSYSSLLGARILQGFGMGACGCLGSSVITDIFFLHEQGTRVAIWQFVFNGSICITPILSGIIAQQLGWRFMFWILLPIEIVAFIACIFLQPESVYQRPSTEGPETVHSLAQSDSQQDKQDDFDSKDTPVLTKAVNESGIEEQVPLSFWKSLRPWQTMNGTKTPILVSIIRPFLTLLSPPIAYATLLFTFTFSWFVLLASVYSSAFAVAPYNFNTAQIGYISGCSPFIGVMIAIITSGPILDHSARYLSKKNDGLFEPEMRLILVVPTTICIAIGAFGFGFAMENGKPWIISAVFLGFLNAGAAYGTVCAISYGISIYPARGGDTFGIIMLVKALYAWSSTLYLADWVASAGLFKWCSTVAAVTLGICVLGLPMYVFGKRVRYWMAGIDTLRWVFE